MQLIEAGTWRGRLLWGGATLLLSAASLLPGGERTALAAWALAVLLIPALRC